MNSDVDSESSQYAAQFFQQEDVKERIRKTLQRIRTEIAMPISHAASLLYLTKNQLRDWEKHGLISPLRTSGGRRLYTTHDIDKLAIIQELLIGGFSLDQIDHPDKAIREYLQQEKVRRIIMATLQRVRTGIEVPTSQVAKLFNFSESQIRNWEKRGLIRSNRSTSTYTSDGKDYTQIGHRRFPLEEVDKLAIVRELLDAGFTINEIPTNIEEIWSEIEQAFSSYFSQTAPETEFQLRIFEEPLTAHNLNTIISSLTNLHTKCWLILSGRLADLINYTYSHDPHFNEEANLVITKITYNSPADIRFNVNAEISPQAIAEALKIGIDAVLHTSLRHEEAKLINQAHALDMKLKEQEAQSTLANQEQLRQIEAQNAELNRRERQIELEAKQLELEQRRLEIQEQRLEIEKKRIEYALEAASKMINILRPNADQETKEMLLQTLLPDLLQMGNGKGLELVLTPAQNVVLSLPQGQDTQQK